MTNRGTAGSSVFLSLSMATALWTVACGGSGSVSGGGAGSGGSGSGETTVPQSCSALADCPSGYVCVPKNDTPTMTVTNTDCLTQCTQVCEIAGPAKDMCLQSCTAGCQQEVPSSGATVEGTCMPSQSYGNGAEAGASGAAGQSSTKSFVWAGAWTADVTHVSKCQWSSSAMQMGQQSYTVTINATGANTAPKATISGGFALEGTGGDDHISLTGDFPFRSWKGEVATTNSLNSPNNATIKITTVESASKVSGTIEGSWNASAGWTCTTESGTITLTR